MKLKDVKKKLTQIAPFIKYDFRGQNDCLVVEGIPLTVEVTPPTMQWIIQSAQITTLILRFSGTYKEHLEKITKGDITTESKSQISQEIMEKMRQRIADSEEEQARMIGVIITLGKEYLIDRSTYAYYKDPADKFRIQFTGSKEEADKWNKQFADDDTKMVVWVDSLTEDEVANIGMRLMDTMPKEGEEPANVPIEGDKITEDGKTEGEVVGTVKADSVATFPRNLRSLVVEDAPPAGGSKSVGNSGGNE